MADARRSVLVVDDEAGIRDTLAAFLGRLGHRVLLAGDGDEALELITQQRPDICLLDIRLPGNSGIHHLSCMTDAHPAMPVIMMTAHGTMDLAVKALRLGAIDFLTKPIHLDELEIALRRAEGLLGYRQQQQCQPLLGHREAGEPQLIGASEAAEQARHLISLAAASPCDTILLVGETGTGKEVCAALFHRQRCGGNAPFVAINCPALPGELVESELFGHERGAFTGAVGERRGAFEQADGGVLFLDEVADLDPAAQAKLLRVLETREVQRLGATRSRRVAVSVIAASNRPLEDCVEEGSFRADLYYRLSAFTVELLPLRERPEDIGPLIDHFLRQQAARSTQAIPTISQAARDKLAAYGFPGNARELRNIIERACVLADTCIEAEHITLGCCLQAQRQRPPSSASSASNPVIAATQEEVEETLACLEACDWNRRQAASTLGISYEALRWRIKKYALQPQ